MPIALGRPGLALTSGLGPLRRLTVTWTYFGGEGGAAGQLDEQHQPQDTLSGVPRTESGLDAGAMVISATDLLSGVSAAINILSAGEGLITARHIAERLVGLMHTADVAIDNVHTIGDALEALASQEDSLGSN